jgi:2-polyprenyl-3-methyl-5-hydroxy-6-metoxy-1,4-benzoquinol methylase
MEKCYLCAEGPLQAVYEHSSGCLLVRCPACGLLYFPQAPSHEYWSSQNIEVYTLPEVQQEERRKFHRYLDWLASELPAGKVLDYGCGIGTFVECALERGWQAHGVEASQEIVRYAQRERKLPIWHLEEWSPAIYDAITLWDVLEHLDDPRGTLQGLVQHLEAGGILMLETPDANFILRRLGLQASRLSRGAFDLARFFFYPDHRYYFSAKTIALLVEQVGLELRWIRQGTTPIPKVMGKLRRVHRASWMIQGMARLALASAQIVGGNKLILCARLPAHPKTLKIQTP